MNNVEKIMFDAKYSVKYMNGIFVISGFNHTKSVHIKDDDMEDFLNDYALAQYNEADWDEFIEDYELV